MIKVRAPQSPSSLSLILAFAAIYVIWGSTYLAIRFAVETIPPGLMLGTRFMLAGALMYALLRLRGSPRPSAANWKAATVIGGFMLLGGTGAVGWAEQWIPSGLAALLVAIVPMWMVLVDWVRPGGVRPGGQVIAGLALGFAGVALLVGPVDLGGTNRMLAFGSFAIILGTLSWAIGSVFSRHVQLADSPWMASAQEMLMGGALLAVAGTLMGEWQRFDITAVSLRSSLGWGYLIVFGSLIAFASYVWLLHHASPARVGSYAYVNPVIAVFLGWALADEPIGLRTMIAAAIIIVAVMLIISFRTPREEEAVHETVAEPAGGSVPAGQVPLSEQLFSLDSGIRYVAVNQEGRIVEMRQSPRWPANNPPETDRLEELVVNPAVIDLTRRRGDLDLNGVRYVAVRYGLQYQLLFPYRNGHLSVGVEPRADVTEVARKVSRHLGLPS